jgi:hypothetical protein
VPARIAPEAVADPIGVIVDLVAAREPGLDRAAIEAVVGGVAGGRAKRRSLAQALLENPGLLVDGRSPAPPRDRGLADRSARRRRLADLPARLRRMRQTPAQLSTPRPGLVLQRMRAPA